MITTNEQSTKKVYIFDDNAEILELCKLILEDMGCEVMTSPTTNNVEQQISDYQPNLIFMDNWLPDISGIEATKLIKANDDLKHIPVIYFTANSNISELAAEAGADAYIEKPFDIEGLENIILQHLK